MHTIELRRALVLCTLLVWISPAGISQTHNSPARVGRSFDIISILSGYDPSYVVDSSKNGYCQLGY